MFKVIGRIEPNIICATDFLIGDMSDINYEFLLLNRPIILLSNPWLKLNFPDIGHRISSIRELPEALQAIKIEDAFEDIRADYVKKAFSVTDITSSDVALARILEASQIDNPCLVLHHKNNQIYKSNLLPLIDSAAKLKINVFENVKISSKNTINVGSHFKVLLDKGIADRFCVHLDHGLKGTGTANVGIARCDYKKNNYFPTVNLHLTAGPMGQARTEMLLGPLKSRAMLGAYPKATSILQNSQSAVRSMILRSFGLEPDLPVITYAPAGEESFEKPGGSLNRRILQDLKQFEKNYKCNMVIKLKYPFYFQRKTLSLIRKKFKNVIFG